MYFFFVVGGGGGGGGGEEGRDRGDLHLLPCEGHGVPLKTKATVRLLELLVKQVYDAEVPLLAASFCGPVRAYQLGPVPLLPGPSRKEEQEPEESQRREHAINARVNI